MKAHKNSTYGWHTDSGTKMQTADGLIRKISASLILVDDDEYEGGNFEICLPNPKEMK